MSYLFPAFVVAFVAFCVWLTVRIVNRQEKWAKWTLAVVVGVTLLCGLPIAWWMADHVWQIRFEPTAWMRADPIEKNRTIRSLMIADLLSKYDFHGWTRQQVEELLGPPEPRHGRECGFPQFDRIYILGAERAGNFSLDDEALGFKFDDDEKVVAFGLSVN